MATVKISRDLLEAFLVLEPGECVSPVEAMAVLHRYRVVFGIQTGAMMRLANLIGPIVHPVALGDPPIHGEDAVIDYYFRTEAPSLAPLVDAQGQADYRNLGLIDNVEAGQVLARRTPPVPGRPGTAVTGECLTARRARDRQLVAGAGTVLNEDHTALVARVAGSPRLDGAAVSVDQTYRVRGNVSLATGHLKFDGDLEIEGDVEFQMQVAATGDVMIHGSVIGARVEAGGSLRVTGKVLHHAELVASGDMVVGFAEYATLQAGGGLRVHDDLVHCRARCRAAVEVGGCLVGGHVVTDAKVSAGTIGMPRGVPTRLEIRLDSTRREALAGIAEERSEIRLRLAQLSDQLRDGRRLLARAPSDARVQALHRLIETFQGLTERDAALKAGEESLRHELEIGRCPVEARRGLYPEVEIHLGQTCIRISVPTLANAVWEGRPVERLS